MRINKLFGARSITNLLYGLIMFLPFMAILGRVIYTQANPYAKDSYSSRSIYQQFAINNDSQFPLDQVFNVKYKTDITGTYCYVSVSYLSYTPQDLGVSQVDYDSITQLRFNGTNNHLEFRVGSNTLTFKNWDDSIDFNLIATSNPTSQSLYTFAYVSQTILIQDNLDNAFEYSLDTFVKNNANLSGINFFGWFDGYFLNQSNSHNLLYLNFANWYMNYALLVSSGYLLFLALMWFINYVRRILDKSQNIDFGGF